MFGRFFGRYFGILASSAAPAPTPVQEAAPLAGGPDTAWFQPRQDRSAHIHRQNQAVILAIMQAAAAGAFR